jgi:hypothetical protein
LEELCEFVLFDNGVGVSKPILDEELGSAHVPIEGLAHGLLNEFMPGALADLFVDKGPEGLEVYP